MRSNYNCMVRSVILIKNYEWILFDADETLFHFDSFNGLKLMFSGFGVDFTQEDYEDYQKINKPLWVDYQNGIITASELQHNRFNLWALKLQVKTADLNSAFLSAMAETCLPIDGALSLLDFLQGNGLKLGIITNGFTALQQVRLKKTGLGAYFEIIVISEEVGVAKPHPDIFNHAIKIMGNPDRQKILMVGDNPHSDIIGGINAGLDTCWINFNNMAPIPGIMPKYQVDSLAALERLFADN